MEVETTYKTRRTERRREKRRQQREYNRIKRNGDEKLHHENNKGCQYHDEETTWGHELEFQEDWPRNQNSKVLRIMAMNTNGITSESKYIEWESLLHSMDETQVDVFSLSEIKVDTRQSQVRYDIIQKAKSKDKYINLKMNSSKQKPSVSKYIFKPGGTMIGV